MFDDESENATDKYSISKQKGARQKKMVPMELYRKIEHQMIKMDYGCQGKLETQSPTTAG